VLAFDRDPAAIEAGHRRFPDEVRLALVGAPFADIAARVPGLVRAGPCAASCSTSASLRRSSTTHTWFQLPGGRPARHAHGSDERRTGFRMARASGRA
jgi:hypothetical protein